MKTLHLLLFAVVAIALCGLATASHGTTFQDAGARADAFAARVAGARAAVVSGLTSENGLWRRAQARLGFSPGYVVGAAAVAVALVVTGYALGKRRERSEWKKALKNRLD
ncbi:putative transmembrane protein [Toxoplasma gondii TgCatPRC2]|uniref:Putative transmembrane protein n=1 Tax=Toxoplasma gondii TgCatPRC2 TaxID=1130821 RepID=A0A151HBB5_TOXGO|nr:putative transmembrane protein [Toxoplasma gondii TgCatPRC2]